jgi:transcriptional regulator of heat shock response
MIDDRQKKIFKSIVREHIATGVPVGSNLLVSKTGLEVSPATMRNEMAELEERGLLRQPHTSAGRVPTESGYQFYVDNLMEVHPLNNKSASALRKIKKNYKLDEREFYKTLAKEMAAISGETVIVAFGGRDIYYTGFSNLFAKPELQGVSFNLGNMIDKMNDVMHSAYHKINDHKVHVKIGKNNPFGDECASVLAKINDHLVVVLGLMRMDYDENVEMMEFLKGMIAGEEQL